MLKMLRRVVLALTVILSVSAVGHADTIFNVLPTNIAVPGPLGFSRFFAAPGPWTDNFLPTGFSGSFQTFRSYNNVSGQILLGASSGTPEVTVSIAKEGPNGEPGTILGSATFFVAGNGMAQLYDFSLTNLVLEDASTYQLFVSTTAAPGPESMTGGFTSWC